MTEAERKTGMLVVKLCQISPRYGMTREQILPLFTVQALRCAAMITDPKRKPDEHQS